MGKYLRKVKVSRAGCGTNNQTWPFARLPRYSLIAGFAYLSLLAIGRATSTRSPIVTKLHPLWVKSMPSPKLPRMTRMNPRSRAKAGDADVRIREREPNDFTQEYLGIGLLFTSVLAREGVENGLVTRTSLSKAIRQRTSQTRQRRVYVLCCLPWALQSPTP